MKIKGTKVMLRPAVKSDRRKVFEWLTQSDLTRSMLGQPLYPDSPIPSWQTFCQDYSLDFFSPLGDGRGRNFIILAGYEEVGTLGYDLLDREKDRVVLDIWLKAERYCGRGFGSDALDTLCRHIHATFGITMFFISPSARNQRAVAAYKKAGFSEVLPMTKEEQVAQFGTMDYHDNIVMVKRIL
jgi:diamine N-acetyltransferase